MRKIIEVCALLLVGVLWLIIGDWFVSCSDVILMSLHYVFTTMFFLMLPIVAFNQCGYRLVAYVLEVMLGFVIFMWLYLDVISEIKGVTDIGWAELLMFDSAVLVATGFGGALCQSKGTRSQQMF